MGSVLGKLQIIANHPFLYPRTSNKEYQLRYTKKNPLKYGVFTGCVQNYKINTPY